PRWVLATLVLGEITSLVLTVGTSIPLFWFSVWKTIDSRNCGLFCANGTLYIQSGLPMEPKFHMGFRWRFFSCLDATWHGTTAVRARLIEHDRKWVADHENWLKVPGLWHVRIPIAWPLVFNTALLAVYAFCYRRIHRGLCKVCAYKLTG